MKKIKILSLLILFFTLQQASAQTIKSFSKEPQVFIKELQFLMTNDKIEPAVKAFEQFKPLWDSNYFDEYQQARIIKNADKMLSKRMKANPHFAEYLLTLIHFYESGLMPTHFVTWQKTLEKYYDAKTLEFMNFVEISNSLFASNMLIDKKNVRFWHVDNLDFQIDTKEGQPAFVFQKTTLQCNTRADSLVIHNTKGYFLIESHVWKGEGGRVDWTRGNFSPTEVYADLKKYQIDLESNKYEADSVTFYQSQYFSGPLIGRIEDVALATSTPETTRYPKFFSYKKDFSITQFAEDVYYTGGFSQQGSKIVGYGDAAKPATFQFKYKNKPFIKLTGKEFIITEDRIVTDKARMEINLDTGTVFHPQVIFNYIKADKKVVCSRGETGVTQAPFTNTYHKMELKADKMEWIMGQPKIEFRSILKDGSVLLFSENYFKEYQYEKIQGMQEENPLAKIKQFCELKGKRKFHLSEYVTWRNSKREYVRFQMVQLTDLGYIMLDSETDTMEVFDKLFNAVNAHMGRTDYDVMGFESIIEKRANATINLESYSMELEGVGRFFFSDSQYVYVIPDEQQVTVLRDRDLMFNGKVRAGRFEFFGKDFRFDYKTFSVDIIKC